MSNISPYISWAGMTIGWGTPRAIGWEPLTVHTRSSSPSLRHSRLQVVPISALKGLE